MNRIRIGVPLAFQYPDKNRGLFSKKTLMYIEKDMANYLARNNAIVIPIPDVPKKFLKPYIDEVDGFLFQGGTDVSPLSYKTPFLNKKKWPGDRYRDRFELYLMNLALKKQKPILGICRGCQLINVFFGGTLYQDIETEKPKAIQHRDADLYDSLAHSVEIKKDSYFQNFYQEKSYRVNSIHHQAIKKVGKDLKAIAHSSDDKIVEAICYKDMKKQYILGVQWHPEFSHTLKGQVPPSDPLMQDFLKRCARSSQQQMS